MQLQPKKFKFTLDIRQVEEDVLTTSPDGWLNLTVKYARSKIYGGIIRSVVLPLKFVEQGRFLLRQEWYTYALMARVNLYIYKLIPETWAYKQLFFGKLDFSKGEDLYDGFSIPATENNINIQIDAYADTNYEIPLILTDDQRSAWIAKTGIDPMVDVLLTPLKLQETADIIFNTSPDFRGNAFFQTSVVSNNQLSVNNSVKSTGFLADPVGAHPWSTDTANNFFTAQTDTKIRLTTAHDPVTGALLPSGVSTSVNGNCRYQFNIYDQTGTLRKTLAQSPAFSVDTEFSFSFDFALDLNSGDRLYFYILNLDSTDTGGSSPGVNMQGGTMTLTYYTSTPASHCKALRPAYVFDSLIQQMNGQNNPIINTQSFLLNGQLSQLAITCSNAILTSQLATIYQAGDTLQIGNKYQVYGDPTIGGVIHYFNSDGVATNYTIGEVFTAILGQPTFSNDPDTDCYAQQISNSPVLIYSYNSFFNSIKALMCGQLATGLDSGTGNYCMEDLRYFYRAGLVALDLETNINRDWSRKPDLEIAFNQFRVGYNDEQYDALNGSQEVCSWQEYTIPMVTPIKKQEFISPTGAAPYSIEQIRILPGAGNPPKGTSGNFYLNSAASKSDARNWFLWLNATQDTGQTYYRPQLASDEGVTLTGVDQSYYNYNISPKHNFLRGSSYIASVFDKMNAYEFTPTAAPKNTNMVVVNGSTRIAESDPVQISSLGSQIFLPYLWTINTGLAFNAETLLGANPFGEVRFTDRGVEWRCFIEQVQVDEGENTAQSFILRPVAGQDLSQLIV